MTTPIETLVAAIRTLANDIESEDGVANAAIAEAAQRLEEQQERIKRLEEAGDAVEERLGCGCGCGGPCRACQSASENWFKVKEAKL
jgi:hypothetical protein